MQSCEMSCMTLSYYHSSSVASMNELNCDVCFFVPADTMTTLLDLKSSVLRQVQRSQSLRSRREPPPSASSPLTHCPEPLPRRWATGVHPYTLTHNFTSSGTAPVMAFFNWSTGYEAHFMEHSINYFKCGPFSVIILMSFILSLKKSYKIFCSKMLLTITSILRAKKIADYSIGLYQA